jgi:hypothetical protein
MDARIAFTGLTDDATAAARVVARCTLERPKVGGNPTPTSAGSDEMRFVTAGAAKPQRQSRCEAMRAPSPSACSFAQAMVIGISVLPAVD